MSVGLVDDNEFEFELLRGKEKVIKPSGSSKLVEIPTDAHSPAYEVLTPRGRKEGDVNVPDSLRKIIGETSVIEGRAAALSLASEFGISASSVSAYAKGATSTTSYDKPKPSIIEHINKSRRRAVSKASKTLNAALGSITQEKLDYADVKDLSTIAKDMSVIIKNLEPPPEVVTSDDKPKGPQFVIFAPSFRKEEQFDVITVNE